MTTVIETTRRIAATLAGDKHPLAALLEECATCPGHCCKNDTILLHPEKGDILSLYDTTPVTHPLTGELAWMVSHKPNGDCVYLGEVEGVGRCTIYHRRPAICRVFDCGRSYANMNRAERRRLVRDGLASPEVLEQGRKVQARRAATGGR
jgi:Fe-S-cluster containining protein